jgi:predicted  nucleic acid-binding Zn-ribbon protein
MGDEHNDRDWRQELYDRMGKVQNNQAYVSRNQELLGDQFSRLEQTVTTQGQQLNATLDKLLTECQGAAATIKALRAKIAELESQIAASDTPAEVQAAADKAAAIEAILLNISQEIAAGLQLEHGTPVERSTQ